MSIISTVVNIFFPFTDTENHPLYEAVNQFSVALKGAENKCSYCIISDFKKHLFFELFCIENRWLIRCQGRQLSQIELRYAWQIRFEMT